jgi:NADH dehydrogenase [ubiquinone] 1 alpha subcomplex assembly factor 7
VSALRQRISDAIRANGPMPVSLYMLMCLHDPRDGYYATRPGLGADFTTAPETSQVFGELMGLWAIHEWVAMGSPSPFWLAELGPGRGVMMADMLRAGRSAPGFLDAARVALIEASPALKQVQLDRLAGHRISHFAELGDIPPGPAIIVANEFLDCLSVRQFVRDGKGWRERQVGLDGPGSLRFGLGPPAQLPPTAMPAGDEVEVAPGLDSIADALAQRFRRHDGRALFVDYGPEDKSPGDTLRAYRAGQQVDPLSAPGECDLTADVDFQRLRRLAETEGLAVFGPQAQGGFLTRLGAKERARSLSAANPERTQEVLAGVNRLISTTEMGSRFRAICLAPLDTKLPPGFETPVT